jgi:ferredoxin-type protein NapH
MASAVLPAVPARGWWRAQRWLVLRRASQAGVLGLFLLGPWTGVWIMTGDLAASRALDLVPLTDPLVLLQSLLAGHVPQATALLGAAFVLTFYALAGGRVYCAWVCPLNVVTDAAAWLRRGLGLRGGATFSRRTRTALLAGVFVGAYATGTLAWELVNPVTGVFRGLLFGMGYAWAVLAAIFALDAFVGARAWCGHLCPVGAFYGLIGETAVVRVSAARRAECNDCLDCHAVCPEPQVIGPALHGTAHGRGPVILAGACTNCGRCIDVCNRNVFEFSTRFHNGAGAAVRAREREIRS